MFPLISNNYFQNRYQSYGINNKNNYVYKSINSEKISTDSVCFTGKSAPSMYSSVFEYLASEIMGRNKKLQVDGSMLSASKIGDALKNLFDSNRVLLHLKEQ